jgi:hypothetical protein
MVRPDFLNHTTTLPQVEMVLPTGIVSSEISDSLFRTEVQFLEDFPDLLDSIVT